MSDIVVNESQLGEALADVLDQYSKLVTKGVKDEAKKAMDQLVKETKATAPVGRRRKHYRDSITSKLDSENALEAVYVWYVKGSDYRLSHLLENGHALRNGNRTSGTHFIKNASDSVIADYEKAIEEVIKNG